MFDPQTLMMLAAQGVPDAQMLLSLTSSQAQQQDSQDRRWRNFCAYMDNLEDQGRHPDTGETFLAAFKRYGLVSSTPLPQRMYHQKMDFPGFMSAIGGYTMKATGFEAENEPDAPAKCDKCKKQGAKLRCSLCGEWYCSVACQKQDWRAHRRTCELAAGPRAPDRMPKTAPPLWSADKYADRFGLQRPKLRTSKGSSSAASTGRSTPPAAAAAASEGSRAAGSGGDGADATDGHGSRLAKNQRKRAKKKEKKAVAAAAAGHAEADDAGHRDQAAAGGEAVEQLAGDVAGVQLE
eukprot:GHUV01002179.1.p1 GENE.GHUV01002179.1~~GHUV01002179.1.p1  ORF type:complete len:342 (+),score=85.16 GHUV01002179.1:148-1026(+)